METRPLDIDAAVIEQLEQVENSITFWSRRLGEILMQYRSAEGHLAGMYSSREKLYAIIIEKANLPKGSKIMNISEDGDVSFSVPPEEPSGS
jgi:hypothetical protein